MVVGPPVYSSAAFEVNMYHELTSSLRRSLSCHTSAATSPFSGLATRPGHPDRRFEARDLNPQDELLITSPCLAIVFPNFTQSQHDFVSGLACSRLLQRHTSSPHRLLLCVPLGLVPHPHRACD
ncbi:hypothetical protein LIA77_06422 [Sarocladium implicatum]|nr:hypothetical protein LIA77_06422 [Sarocladium implicatum]